jgi:acetolactate synthase-1/2/3 large subunit
VLDGRSPFSVTLPLGRELWGEADAVLAVGTRLLNPMAAWGVDKNLQIVRVDADRDEPARQHKPQVALIGDAAPVLRKLIDGLAKTNARRAARRDEMVERQAKWKARLQKIAPQLAFVDVIRATLPEDGIYVDEVTQIGFAARLAYPVYKPRTFLSPGYQDNLGWGYATALGVQHARPDVPVLSINGDGGFLYTGNELATAMRHRIPLVAVVFVDGAFGNVRRIQQEQFGNRVIASDLTNPDFVKYAESFGAAGRRARSPAELASALKAAFAAREPTLIEVPVGALPSPWEFIHMPSVRRK